MEMTVHAKALLSKILDYVLVFLGLATFSLLVYRFGFYVPYKFQSLLSNSLEIIGWCFILQEALRWLTMSTALEHFKNRWLENGFAVVLLISLVVANHIKGLSMERIAGFEIKTLIFAYLAITQMLLFLTEFVRFFRQSNFLSEIELTPSKLMVFSFLIPITIGTLLLKLPKATVAGIDWVDAIFTSTSAVCVTGLIVVDTATAFTPLGQTIIALLFQVGGLGIMTLTMSFGLIFSGTLGVRERILFAELMSEDRVGQVGRLLQQITIFTLTIEAVGMLLLYNAMGKTFVDFDAVAFLNAAFHSISAFCNAGFSLFTENLATPLLKNNGPYSLIISVLVILGGLGFPVIQNLFRVGYDKVTQSRSSRALMKVHSRLVLASSAILLVAGALFIFLAESQFSFRGLSDLEKLRQAFFLSAASRTAGFNIWPTDELSLPTCVFLFALMWIGGSPMSTAGGIKNLTFSVGWLNLVAMIRGAKHIRVFNREIDMASVQKAFGIMFGSILVITMSALILILLEPQKKPLDLVFETFSAFGTVGLSRGVTPHLSDVSKLLIVFLMFTGRIGFITVVNSIYRKYQPPPYKVLKETIPIS